MKKLKIIMVDDNIQFRTSLRTYLESNLNCEVIAEASNGIEFLQLSGLGLSDIVLMDIAMAEMDGIEATKKAIWNFSHLKIIALTMQVENVYLRQLIENGFKGCVFKTDIFSQLFTAINHVMDGKVYMPNSIQFDN